MESPAAYIPMDRRQAIARGEWLPDRARGAALFADISGFTPLTEALHQEHGPKRGAEELTRQLNLIYDSLVTEVHRYGGSVLAFSGDAITCWFDGDDGFRATGCGLSMQQAMGRFEAIKISSGQIIPLAMKVAIAAGPVRRFQLGDPQIQFIDTLAGATLDRMAEAEHHAKKSEVVVIGDIIAKIKERVELAGWRYHPQTGEPYGLVASLSAQAQSQVEVTPWPPLAPEALREEQVRPWVLPPVFERLQLGQGEFLAELRPAVILFLYFSGIDYDGDERAGAKLDAYIRWVQGILARYDSYIFQLTIGDKGSYLYTAFGAPIAHEDDAVRAVAAALELQSRPPELDYIGEVKIGISQGQIYAGAYGGVTRRTYGVLGDEVNLAARLMQAAAAGQILASEFVRHAAGDSFSWDDLPAIKVKGKAAPIKIFSPAGRRTERAIHLQEPAYALPMVGRAAELQQVGSKLELVLAGRGQIIGITAEAGMGKSRLVAEIIRLARERHLVGYGGECQSFGTNISYLVWQPIWSGFFGLDLAGNLSDQMQELERQLELLNPALTPRLPLLGAVLNLPIPDNDLTRTFDAKLRKTSLESLLVDCLQARARQTPLLIVLEDCHWLDPMSHDLLEVIGRAIIDLPVLLILAYRPPELERLRAPRVEQLAYFTEIALADFTPQESERLIGLKLEQFFGAGAKVSPGLLKRITDRAQGNPFYIEELLNYLQDQGYSLADPQALARFELPTSLHSLILSRIDQLSEHQKSTIKVASVIGRLFEAGWLWGVYPELGAPEHVRADLELLSRLELTSQDRPDPELTYIFKHVVTQEVAYESLPYAMRAILHDQFGLFLERTYPDKLDRYVELLAFHFEHSHNEAKKREYLRKAGAAAQAEYANEAAINYYQRLLPLLPAAEQLAIRLNLGEILQLVGRLTEADELYRQTLALAEQLGDRSAQAWCYTAMGELFRKQGQYAAAWTRLEQARTIFEALDDQAGVGQVLHYGGTVAWNQGDYEVARRRYEESLAIRRQLHDQDRIARLLSNLGLVAQHLGDYESARQLYTESLEIRYKLGDKWAIAISLNNLGYLSIEQGNYEAAWTQLDVAVSLYREVGERLELATALNNLGNVARDQGDYATARSLYEEGLTINRALENKYGLAYLLEDVGGMAALQGQPERALQLAGAAASLREVINAPLPPAEQARLEEMLAPARAALGEVAAAVVTAGQAMTWPQAVDYALME